MAQGTLKGFFDELDAEEIASAPDAGSSLSGSIFDGPSLGGHELDGPRLGQGQSLLDMGPAGGPDTLPSASPYDFLAKGGVVTPPAQPVNQATMECLRMGKYGHCMHYFQLEAKGDFQSDRLHVQIVRQCNAQDVTTLTDQNIYKCNLWWPTALAFVPLTLRGYLRPHIRRLYEEHLKRQGYDFSWRTWPEDVFNADDQAGRRGSNVEENLPGKSYTPQAPRNGSKGV